MDVRNESRDFSDVTFGTASNESLYHISRTAVSPSDLSFHFRKIGRLLSLFTGPI